MSDEREKWAEIGVASQQAVEPEWEPGQYVMLTPTSPSLGVGHTLARREYDIWVTFEGWLLSDDEVTDIEPVTVFTAEDVRTEDGPHAVKYGDHYLVNEAFYEEHERWGAAIDRVRALHYQVAGDLDDDDRTWCHDCDVTWPCNTIRALGEVG